MTTDSATRVAPSKGTRFDVFHRDGFTCAYCGRQPPDVVLELDHIHPVSKGGGNDALNLITSCEDCNRGKRDKVLGHVAPRPDADLLYLATQQEIVEARRYLSAKVERDAVYAEVVVVLTDLWNEEIGTWSPPPPARFRAWLTYYPAQEIDIAIRLVGPKVQYGDLRGRDNIERYVTGVLKNRARP